MQTLFQVIYECDTKKKTSTKPPNEHHYNQCIPQLSSLNFHLLFNPKKGI